MGQLTPEQLDFIERDIEKEGITFDPLRNELLDHLICDIEIRIENGEDFDKAWKSVKAQIPENHFKQVQKETMELLNKKIDLVNAFAILSAGSLILGAICKMLHWPGAGMLLLFSLIGTSLTMLLGTARSFYIYKNSKGRIAIMATMLLIVGFITGLCFKILHLPGASLLIAIPSLALSILLPSLSIYFYQSKETLKDHLLIKLIENNQKNLEYIAIFLIGMGLLMNYNTVLMGVGQNFGGVIFFLFSVVLIGTYTYTYTWIHYVQSENRKNNANTLLLIFSSLAYIMFMMPLFIFFMTTHSDLSSVFRHIGAYGGSIIFYVLACVYYARYSDSTKKHIIAPFCSALIFYPFIRFGIKMEWFEGFLGGLTTNNAFILGFLLFLINLLIAFRKERLFRAVIIPTIASHMIPNL